MTPYAQQQAQPMAYQASELRSQKQNCSVRGMQKTFGLLTSTVGSRSYLLAMFRMELVCL
jgi:hypothetical protein